MVRTPTQARPPTAHDATSASTPQATSTCPFAPLHLRLRGLPARLPMARSASTARAGGSRATSSCSAGAGPGGPAAAQGCVSARTPQGAVPPRGPKRTRSTRAPDSGRVPPPIASTRRVIASAWPAAEEVERRARCFSWGAGTALRRRPSARHLGPTSARRARPTQAVSTGRCADAVSNSSAPTACGRDIRSRLVRDRRIARVTIRHCGKTLHSRKKRMAHVERRCRVGTVVPWPTETSRRL